MIGGRQANGKKPHLALEDWQLNRRQIFDRRHFADAQL
jgi:hypothetical protein